MRRYLDPLALLLTRNLKRIFPSAPILHEWPPLKRIVVGGYLVAYRAFYAKVVIRWALHKRKKLSQVLFVGVTGSAGKTMAKEMIAAILSSQGVCGKTPGNGNGASHIARIITTLKQKHRFCVLEVATGGPGQIARSAEIAQPHIGVVTNIGTDHYRAFGSLEAIADEKAQLIKALPEEGIAVLNADDPHVMAMTQLHSGRTITYGTAPSATLRAEGINATWPDRLSFNIIYQDQSLPVKTGLYGRHWVTSILAALATGLAAGVPLSTSIETIEVIGPTQGRMNLVADNNGITFVRDDHKAPLWSIPLALEFIKEARADRKIVVIGTISDAPGDSGRHYVRTAKLAIEAADHVIFVGPHASHVLNVKPFTAGKTIRAFARVKEVSDFLTDFLQKGDLVLLKGSTVDHLGRIFLARTIRVKCWRDDCHFNQLCDACNKLTRDSSLPVSATLSNSKSLVHRKQPASERVAKNVQVIVGLGNPGKKFKDTPHNVGFQVLDCIADRLEAKWTTEDEVLLAQVQNGSTCIYLVKPRVFINQSGPILAMLSERLGFGPENCVLLFDDIDLSFGKIRIRMHGSDGGHRGVRSILMAFQSNEFRRVKIGVKQLSNEKASVSYLLRPFVPELRSEMKTACYEAADRALELAGERGT